MKNTRLKLTIGEYPNDMALKRIKYPLYKRIYIDALGAIIRNIQCNS